MKLLLISILCICSAGPLCGQYELPSRWGIELSAPGPGVLYPTVTLGGWGVLKNRFWTGGEFGYTPKGRDPLGTNNDWRYSGAARKFTLSGQAFFNGVHKSYFSWFVGSGPYWLDVDGDVGHGFIYNLPEGAMTAHSGAQMHLRRIGLKTSTGVRFFVGPITMGVQLHLLSYRAKTSFEQIENPLLVVDFKPSEVRSYQEAVSEFQYAPALTFHAGVAFESRR